MSPEVATVSHVVAAGAFLLLSCLLLTTLRRPHGGYLAIASVATALWAASIAWWPEFSFATALLELARDAGWCVFLLALLGVLGRCRRSRVATGAVVLLSGLTLSAVCYHYLGLKVFGLDGRGLVLGCYLCFSIGGMLLVEQAFRNATDEGRWGIKFACLGIGGLFAFDFYLYSEALLFWQINPDVWSARGVIDALTVPLIAVSAARSAHWNVDISVSRRFLFNSIALFGTALYLLSMAAAGYYLRYFGGSWGTVFQSAFLFGAVLLLGTVVFSGAFRAHLKVFLSKHFYTYNYDYREEWMRFTLTLAQGEHRLSEQAVKAIADLVESPGGALWIKRESGHCEQSDYWNMYSSSAVEPADSEFCRFMEQEQWIIDLDQCRKEPQTYRNLPLPEWLAELPRAWLVVPLILHSRLFGFVVLARARSPVQLNWEVLDLLKIAGRQAASYLAQNEAAHALTVARQFESYNRMSTFVVHDLKNLVTQLSLLVSNAHKFKDSPEFQQDMLETVSYSVEKMKLLLQKFNRSRSPELPGPVSLDRLLKQVVDGKSSMRRKPMLVEGTPDMFVFANSARLERVVSHFLLNAIEATPEDGEVWLKAEREGNGAVIICHDTGQGMSEEFMRERLFKPFESTKSTGMGIGVFEAREYVDELGGVIEVASRVGAGTTFRIRLPLYERDEQPLRTAA